MLLRLVNLIPIFIALKAACEDFCVPPREKKEKANYHIYTAATVFERFCATKNLIIIDRKDIGTITKEGYYASCGLALLAAVELALNFGCSYPIAVATTIIFCFLAALIGSFKKRILRLSRKILIKRNII